MFLPSLLVGLLIVSKLLNKIYNFTTDGSAVAEFTETRAAGNHGIGPTGGL